MMKNSAFPVSELEHEDHFFSPNRYNNFYWPMRKIIHIDLDAFFCSVEELLDPSLIGKAFAVGGKPGQRGVVSSCSYAARQFGVRSAMPTGNALRLCPGLILVGGSHSRYSEYSRRVMAILERYSGLIEQVSIDEAFLDVSDLQVPGVEIAKQIQGDVRTKVGLPCSLGIATSKLVAKIATDHGKSQHRGATPPSAITEVLPGKEAEFLAPLPVDALWGVGPKTKELLSEWGIKTIGELASQNENEFLQAVRKLRPGADPAGEGSGYQHGFTNPRNEIGQPGDHLREGCWG